MAASAPLNVVILAAGKGARMRSARPKVLHEAAGLPLLAWAIRAAQGLGKTSQGLAQQVADQ